MRTILVALLVASISPAAQERKSGPPDDVIFERDVVYGKGAGEDLKLNIARPKEQQGALPCIVFIHGGGWAAGSKEGHNQQTWDTAKKGYVSATIGYRFAPKHRFPAQIEDAKCAIRFLRANAEKYGIEKDKIGAVGFSAGAHLSMLLGTMDPKDGLEGDGGNPDQSSKVNCVVSWFGPTDLTKEYPDASRKIVETFIGGTKEEKQEACRQASPVTYVDKGDAPMLLIQGTKDRLVPYTQAYLMIDALAKAGVTGRLDMIVGADHGWGGTELQRTADETFAFFDQYLKTKKK
jgi:acetyl esterase/lipase